MTRLQIISALYDSLSELEKPENYRFKDDKWTIKEKLFDLVASISKGKVAS